MSNKIVAIVGPTASGKTSLGISLAKKFNGEIISADSRQVYKGMDIGTGKVTKREMRGIPHHLLDVASPRRKFTVAYYQKLGRRAIKKILAEGKLPIVVGGSGLYVDALLYRYTLPDIKPNLRLRRALEKKSAAALFETLKKLDPRRAGNIDRFNKRRLVRAIEIITTTKQPVPSASESLNKESDYDVLRIGIAPTKKTLAAAIARRLSQRLRSGMIAEVRSLHEKTGLSWQRLDDLGLEYRYIARYLQGMMTRHEMETMLRKEIEKYAARQMTWFRKDGNVAWIKNPKQAQALVKKFLR